MASITLRITFQTMHGVYRPADATPFVQFVVVVITIIIISLSSSLTASSDAFVQADRAQLELFRSNACPAAVIDIGEGALVARPGQARSARRGSCRPD